MADIKDIDLNIRFYKNPLRNKQNMWIDGKNLDGKRYEINHIEDVNNSILDYLEEKKIIKNII